MHTELPRLILTLTSTQLLSANNLPRLSASLCSSEQRLDVKLFEVAADVELFVCGGWDGERRLSQVERQDLSDVSSRC